MRVNLILCSIAILLCCCEPAGNGPGAANSTYFPIEPSYEQIQLIPTTDTIRFELAENAYNSLKSFNTFLVDSVQYISFFERRSGDINIYNVSTKQHVKRVHIDEKKGGKDLINATAYCRNFDTILVNNVDSLLFLDSSANIIKKMGWPKHRLHDEVVMENTRPPVIQNGKLFTGVRPSSRYRDMGFVRKWKIFFEFIMPENKVEFIYRLPTVYMDSIYGYFYQDYNYCLNDKGRFVISFPLDTNIYETDLQQLYNAYLGKSKSHTQKIPPMHKKGERLRDDHRHYSLNFAYGAIYFDPYHKRYVRIAREAIPITDFNAGVKLRKSHVLIFDEKFRIIGESDLPLDISTSSLFFTPDGKAYVRTKVKDEYAIYFVRLQYEMGKVPSKLITGK